MNDPRDKLWDAVWLLAYKAAYAKEASAFMLKRWLKIDLFFRAVVAVATPASAITGWALWQSPTGKTIWALIAGIASVCAVLDGIFAAQERVRRYSELSSLFTRLHQDLLHIQDDMKLQTDFDISSVRMEYEGARKSYADLLGTFPTDLFFSRRAEFAVQRHLNATLSNGN